MGLSLNLASNLGKKAPKVDDSSSSFGTESPLESDIQVIAEEESGLTSSRPESKLENEASSSDSLNMGSVPASVIKNSVDTSKYINASKCCKEKKV